MTKFNVYIGKYIYSDTNRSLVVDILKPLVPKVELNKYGLSSFPIKIVDDVASADFILLPYCWNYYVLFKQLSFVKDMIHKANLNNKKILIWVTGDYYYSLPRNENIIGLFRSPYKTKIKIQFIALPVIINDSLIDLNLDKIPTRNYSNKPLVSFCGHVDSNLFFSIFKIGRLMLQNMAYYLKISKRYSGPLTPATLLRKKILDSLDSSECVQSDFIRRKKYQAGVKKDNRKFQDAKREFYNNIIDSDYVLCVRGTGNFSARFYETLSLGRIPVFIDTDCVLPYRNLIDWNRHIVWVKENEILEIDKKIIKFHNNLNPESFIMLQNQNRKLWEDYFSFPGHMNKILIDIKEELYS